MLDVISIGTATADIFIKSPDLGRLRGGAKIETDSPCVTVGGGAYNSAVTFSKKGLVTGLFSKIGDDIFGQLVRNAAAHSSIRPFFLDGKRGQTGVSFILLSQNGERTILVYRGVSGDFSKSEVLPVPKAKWAYIHPGSMSLAVLLSLIGKLQKNGTRIAINPSLHMLSYGISRIRPILNKSNVVILNREEASALTGVPFSRRGEIFKKLDADVLGIAIMTDGKNGSAVSDGKTIISSPAFRVKKVIDMTGAGDAFGSAFVAALIEKGETCGKNKCDANTLAYALREGSKNAALVIQHIGATEGLL